MLDSSFNDDCSDDSSSAVGSTEEEMENHNRNESLQSMHLERLRLASDEANAKKNGLCVFEDVSHIFSIIYPIPNVISYQFIRP